MFFVCRWSGLHCQNFCILNLISWQSCKLTDEAELEAEDRPSKMEKGRTERRKKERNIQRREREIDGDDDDDDDHSDVDETISQNDSEENDEDDTSPAKKLEKLDRGIEQKQSRGRVDRCIEKKKT